MLGFVLCIGNTKMKRYGTALKQFRLKKVGRRFYFTLAVVVHEITHYSNSEAGMEYGGGR